MQCMLRHEINLNEIAKKSNLKSDCLEDLRKIKEATKQSTKGCHQIKSFSSKENF